MFGKAKHKLVYQQGGYNMYKEKEFEINQPPSEPELTPASPPEFKPFENIVQYEKTKKEK